MTNMDETDSVLSRVVGHKVEDALARMLNEIAENIVPVMVLLIYAALVMMLLTIPLVVLTSEGVTK